ncbi:alpha/beta fold hydrolase [Niabella drilacis]|uniref:Pimeloyl-ACP methyl ester carboxylesterase n=1 Tax=Niabella drilacis (strain DSM 25811 / CCM 8410 / CCUG 62505 / LMG 26954 / E90) TaxID=1285928 RepID=A0A1G6T5Y3_NIADE|nr:alpha/beta hydrolase [Niabella drilacis]SDD24449.1 Pimeloyl-ACP methyl ester carboxylesterase [Niabella drilacis]
MKSKKTGIGLMLLLMVSGISGCGRLRVFTSGYNNAVGKYYDIRGIRMYTETYGKGRPLLMIHGNGGDMSAFANNIPYFSKKYKVILADSRAHGRSADASDSLSFEMMADDYAALLTAMHISRADVLGWSDGGIIALEMAMRYPEKVTRLASSGANLWADSLGLRPDVWLDGVKEYNAWQKRMPLTDAKEKNDYKVFMLDYEQPDIALEALQKIKCPALIIGGDNDLIPVEHTRQIAAHIPRGRLWIVPNSGHATLIDHSRQFNREVDAFFRRPLFRYRHR